MVAVLATTNHSLQSDSAPKLCPPAILMYEHSTLILTALMVQQRLSPTHRWRCGLLVLCHFSFEWKALVPQYTIQLEMETNLNSGRNKERTFAETCKAHNYQQLGLTEMETFSQQKLYTVARQQHFPKYKHSICGSSPQSLST
jgi:hypothetical protein